MSDESMSWDDFYKKVQGRPPRQLLLDALEKFPEHAPLQAIDLGCGDGTESAVLLSRGWHVLAVDAEPAALQRLLAKVPQAEQANLQTRVAKFEDVTLPASDLVHASFSLPFCHPDHFPALWQKITRTIKPGGRFAGQFFGVRDSWADEADMTFHTEAQVRALLEDFDIESFQEMDEDGQSASGPKHWHVFTIIARKI